MTKVIEAFNRFETGAQAAKKPLAITIRLIPILGNANSSWQHGQTTRHVGNHLKLNNDFAFDRCTVATLEESVSPRVAYQPVLSQGNQFSR